MSADITKPETWYGLKLGETISALEKNGSWFALERVPGGWIYWYEDKPTFIPFSPEFKEDK